MEIEQGVLMILAVVVVAQQVYSLVQQFWIQKSIPTDQIPAILAELRRIAEQTPTTADDQLLNAGEKIAGQLGIVIENEDASQG